MPLKTKKTKGGKTRRERGVNKTGTKARPRRGGEESTARKLAGPKLAKRDAATTGEGRL